MLSLGPSFFFRRSPFFVFRAFLSVCELCSLLPRRCQNEEKKGKAFRILRRNHLATSNGKGLISFAFNESMYAGRGGITLVHLDPSVPAEIVPHTRAVAALPIRTWCGVR